MTSLKQAKTIEIYDVQGNLIPNYKAVTNQVDDTEVYSIVSNSYKITQHDEVVDTIDQTVKELGLSYNKRITELNNGARINMEITFPDLQIDLGNDDVSLFRITLDNSYDCTTGVRLDLGAFRLVCTNGLYVGEKWANSYQRHSKKYNCNDYRNTIEKGIEVFQTKIKNAFEKMVQYSITPNQARAFLDDALEKKVIAAKYIVGMKQRLDYGSDVEFKSDSQMMNKWNLYNLISEELTHNCTSIDSQRRSTYLMNKQLNKTFAVAAAA